MKKVLLSVLIKIVLVLCWVILGVILWVTFPIWSIAGLCLIDTVPDSIDARHRRKYFDYDNQNF